MRTIIIGDIHGRTIWKEILKKEKYDRVIFIGDYFDTHYDIEPIQQLNNFEQICKFKRESDKEIIMLIGNHDYHYWPGIRENYSGYQPRMRQSFEGALNENRDLLQIAFEDDDTLYTHAGVTNTFMGHVLRAVGADAMEGKKISSVLNTAFESKPNIFGFYPWDASNNGGNINQSCIWVRPWSLEIDQCSMSGEVFQQVVGHTSQKKIDINESSPKIILVDALEAGQYLIKDEGVYSIGQV